MPPLITAVMPPDSDGLEVAENDCSKGLGSRSSLDRFMLSLRVIAPRDAAGSEFALECRLTAR